MKFNQIKEKIDGTRSLLMFGHIRHVMHDSVINGDITIEEYRTLLDLLYDEERIANRAKNSTRAMTEYGRKE